MHLVELSQTFKAARIAARLTQREAARAAGVSTILVSKFERAALAEIGAVKLLALLRVVGLELYSRPAGQKRTVEHIAGELGSAGSATGEPPPRQRVRHARVSV